jgi:rhodanese-related sulfurtransferase
MSRLPTALALTAAGFAMVSCTEPSSNPPPAPAKPADAPAPPRQAAETAFKKKPRMNGRGEITSVSLEQFFELHQSGKALVFDARPGFFYNIGHIPGAVHLSKFNCDEEIHKREAEIKAALAAGKILVVYCTSLTCPDARTVARHLSGFGYPASIFSGGWDAWKEAGMPVE